jgi:hypothetical protein
LLLVARTPSMMLSVPVITREVNTAGTEHIVRRAANVALASVPLSAEVKTPPHVFRAARQAGVSSAPMRRIVPVAAVAALAVDVLSLM